MMPRRSFGSRSNRRFASRCWSISPRCSSASRKSAKLQSASQPHATSDDREVNLRIKQLALSEQHIVTIADQTINLINETEFSIALPPAIQSIQRRCIFIVNDFQQGRDADETVASEKQVKHDLQDLIDTFKILAQSKMGNGQCNCKGDKNKLLAELKVLRHAGDSRKRRDGRCRRPPGRSDG